MKSPDNNRLILYQLIRLIKEISPKKQVQNPYADQIENLSFLNLGDQLLFHDLLQAITQLNAHSRTNEAGQLIATESDMLNALQLLQPIDIKSVQTHERLLHYFKDQPFTYLDAQVRLRMSEGTLRRRFRTLLARKMLTKLPEKSMFRQLFKVNPFHQLPSVIDESTFETMQGEWKDFVGFVEF
ncbi:MAG: hypothetical protein GY816_15010 [Cytophagales bacterium]|nr:hypothetical protein [Cytophagales bacterium]